MNVNKLAASLNEHNSMRNLILVISFSIFFSCTEKKVIEQLSRNNELLLYTYGKHYDDRFVASFSSTETSKDTLFISKIEYVSDKKIKTVKRIKLSRKEVDSLYSYFQDIKNNFKPESRESEVLDGTSVAIVIRNNATSVSYSYRGLDKAENSTMEIRKLMRFINSRLPKDYQMY